jgi:hypothetical protein
MTNGGTNRTAAVLVALLVGVGLGWFIAKSSTAPAPTVDQFVYVGPKATDVNPPSPTIQLTGHVFWKTNPAGHRLAIVFPTSGFPSGITVPPFQAMMANGNEYNAACSGDSCASGNVNPDLPKYPPGTVKTYKYDQVLDGVRADGRIIIQW